MDAKLLIAVTPAADQTDKEGYAVEGNGSGAASVCNAATDMVIGVIVSGAATTGKSVIALPGSIANVKLGGTVKALDRLQVESDGTCIKDAGSGARAVFAMALQDGVENDLASALILAPIAYAS